MDSDRVKKEADAALKRDKREEQRRLIALEEAKETLDDQKALKDQQDRMEKVKRSRAAS